MVLRKIMGIFAITLMVGAASFATAGIPDLDQSVSSRAYTGPEAAVMFNMPNAGGTAFTAARILTGPVDATVTLVLKDGLGAFIANFPFEDMWLQAADGGMVPCTGGSTADFNTDVVGETSWVNPMAAGGFSQSLTEVMISGIALTSSAGELISHNSADINGDGVVNLSDIPSFVGDLNGAYNFRSDFAFDGLVNLSDVVRMSSAIGASCP